MLKTSGFRIGWHTFGLALILLGLCPGIGAADSAKDNWIKALLQQLKASRRYPLQATDQGGSAKVVFQIDRAGRLLSAALTESTGDPALDQEALAMVERAQPFPPPPPDLPDSDLTLLLPVVFAPRRTSELDHTRPNHRIAQQARLNGVCRSC
ncbi:energy transducer TonB [Bradyrhizobium oligotrophicum]|uniref:energy transducer TonB n=1 Tax=Bradyrhizobium oligotrophicum TaxID=44255 RepID=UPI003EBA535E